MSSSPTLKQAGTLNQSDDTRHCDLSEPNKKDAKTGPFEFLESDNKSTARELEEIIEKFSTNPPPPPHRSRDRTVAQSFGISGGISTHHGPSLILRPHKL